MDQEKKFFDLLGGVLKIEIKPLSKGLGMWKPKTLTEEKSSEEKPAPGDSKSQRR